MKKRLLITSIVMMLVVAVALSTATYAWFTSNTSVKADAVVLTAATMSGEAILITHNADGTEASQRIVLTTTTDKLYPATPNVATTAFTSFTGNSVTNIADNFQNLLQDGTGNYTVPELASGDVSLYKDTFYVFNKGFQSTTLVPTVTINYNSDSTTSAMAAQSARVAIIERVPSAEVAINSAITANMSTYTLKGIWQFNPSGAVYTAITNEEFSATAAYYSRSGEGTTQDPYVYTALTGDNKVTTDNYATKVAAGLYIVTGNTAADGANGSYGATASNSTYVNSNYSYTPSAFTAIGAATSGNHIANEYTVVVWLEGWDADCTNQITAGAFNVSVDFVTAPRGN